MPVKARLYAIDENKYEGGDSTWIGVERINIGRNLRMTLHWSKDDC